jgi:hypothetical protein
MLSFTSFASGSGYGYGTLSFDGARSATWQFRHAADDKMLDTFTITK